MAVDSTALRVEAIASCLRDIGSFLTLLEYLFIIIDPDQLVFIIPLLFSLPSWDHGSATSTIRWTVSLLPKYTSVITT